MGLSSSPSAAGSRHGARRCRGSRCHPSGRKGSVSPPTEGAQRAHSPRCRPARTTTGPFVSICAMAINGDIVAQRPGSLQPEPALPRPGLALPPGTPG